MTLTHSHKKYLKKNLNKLSLEKIAANLGLKSQDILNFAKKNWPREKYQKLIKKNRLISQTKDYLPIKNNFNFKSFFFQNWKVFLFLAILVLAVYFNSLNNDFLSDDIAGIKDNQEIDKISYFFKPPFELHFQSLTIFLIHKIFGFQPIFYRLSNIFSHLGSTWLVYLILSFFFTGFIPLMTAAIFAVHPVLVESVTWISGISYSSGAFWGFLTFLFYILFNQKKEKKFYFLSLIFFIIAFLFSEKLIILPIILLFYEFCFSQFKKNWRHLIPFFVLSFLFALKLLVSLGERTTALETTYYQQPGMDNPLIQIPVAISSYLKLIFWPKSLTLYHSELNFTQGQYFLMVVITLAFFAFIAWSFKKNRQIFFWSSFFIITLLPFLTPLRISWVVAERYVYLGSLGIIVLIALALNKIGELMKNKKIIWIIFSLLILALATRTVVRNFDWKNQDTLWLATAKTSPSSHQNHNNLGDMYARHGDYQKAIEEFQKAIELKPDYGDAYHNLANVYHQTNQDDLALENYQKALSLNPNLWQSHQNLAAIYFSQEKFELAKEELEKAIKINPENAELHTNLGIIYLKLNDKQKAKEEFEKALQINPQNQKAQQMLSSF